MLWAQAPVAGAPTTTTQKLDAFVYRIGMEDPEKHEFQVELSFSDISGSSVDLQLPKWNPGAYKLTEAHRNVRGVVAEGAGGKAVPVVKVDEITWRVTHGGEPFKVRLPKGGGIAEGDRVYLHPASLTFFPEGGTPIEIERKSEIRTTFSSVRAPQMILERTSVDWTLVPMRCSREGASSCGNRP